METEICKIIATNEALRALEQEEVLDLELALIDVPTAMDEIAKCHKHLRINEKEISNLTMNSVRYSLFNSLFEKATLLRGESDQPYLTALKINFGIKNSKIFLVFQPVCLNKSTNPLEPNRYYVYEGEEHYCYPNDESGFVSAKVGDLESLESYKDNIRIKHAGTEIFTEYIDGIDSHATIIPFQLIFQVIYDNKHSTDVFFFNGVVEREIHNVLQINHTVLIGTARDNNPIGIANNIGKKSQQYKLSSIGFGSMYANRSHLCPPCNYIDNVKIARSAPTICVI